MCIAQEILDSYFVLKKELMNARQAFLKAKVKREKDQQYILSLTMPKFNINNSERILARKHQSLIKTSKETQAIAVDPTAFFRNKRENERLRKSQPKSARPFTSHTRNPDEYHIHHSSLYGSMTRKQFMHTIHPSSKLIIDKRKVEAEDNGVKFKFPVEVDMMESKFRLRQTHSLGIVTKNKFVMSNSSGPLERKARFVAERNPSSRPTKSSCEQLSPSSGMRGATSRGETTDSVPKSGQSLLRGKGFA